MPKLKLPFQRGNYDLWGRKRKQLEETSKKQTTWIESVKQTARENIKNEFELVRIAWCSRYKVPKHPHYLDYHFKELLLEMWEQFYYENPDHLDLKGIIKRVNQDTGYAYYATGDALFDGLEEAFGRGENPDLESAFSEVLAKMGQGPNIFKQPVFEDEKGVLFAPLSPLQNVQINEKGEKITETGSKIEHTDFSSDEWVKKALEEDQVLKNMASKMGQTKQ